MPRVRLTVRQAESLKPIGGERTDYFDKVCPGLVLRVSAQGKRTWNAFLRVNGKQRRFKLGTIPALTLADARDQATEARRKAEKGQDPSQERQEARERSFAALAELYIDQHARPHKRSWRDDDRMLRKELLPHWKHVLVRDVTRSLIRDRLHAIVRRGAGVKANRVLALVRKVLNFAANELGWIDVNFASGIKRPAAERTRERVLTDEELRAVWTALEAREDLVAAATKLRLLTAQRGGEVFSMRWTDLDLEGGWWTIPATVAKNAQSHRVPLSETALSILATLKGDADRAQKPAIRSPYVFRGVRGKRQHGHALDGIKISEDRALDGVVPHDLRRTVASRLAGAGQSRTVVKRILNHADRDVTAVYDRHSYDDQKRRALDWWDQELTKITAEKSSESNVVSFR